MSTLAEGLSTSLIGILVVFLGLEILIGIISLMRLFSRQEKPQVQQTVKPPLEAETLPEDDGALVAAIMAAVSAVMQQEGEASSFIVRKIRRRGLAA